MSILAALVVGIILALVLIFVANRQGLARRVYAVGLACAAAVYVVFALAGRASPGWLGLEVIGLVGFGAAALLGLRAFPLVLAFGWAVHVAWDVLLHLEGAGAAYTPSWYPWLCLSFDLIIAGAVLKSHRHPVEKTSASV